MTVALKLRDLAPVVSQSLRHVLIAHGYVIAKPDPTAPAAQRIAALEAALATALDGWESDSDSRDDQGQYAAAPTIAELRAVLAAPSPTALALIVDPAPGGVDNEPKRLHGMPLRGVLDEAGFNCAAAAMSVAEDPPGHGDTCALCGTVRK